MRLSYISDALTELGYKEFIVENDSYEGIRWVETPDNIPTKEDIDNTIADLKAKDDAKAAAKESGFAKLLALGLTEDEIKNLIGGI